MSLFFEKDDLWSPHTNQPKTRSLFTETCIAGDNPKMTLNGGRDEHQNLPCLRDLFISLVVNDPSEVVFAETVFGEVNYWLRLRETKWMKEYLKDWRLVTDTKRKQKAFQAILAEIEEGGRSSFTAAKYLIEEPWKDKRKKEEAAVNKATTRAAADSFADDISRLKEDGLLQ